jgi:hypothetical protein
LVAPPPIRYAHNGDVSIAYTVLGDGPVDVLFMGGFVSHLEIAFEAPFGGGEPAQPLRRANILRWAL